MALFNKDEVKGKMDKVKGTVKENVGRATNNHDMEAEGAADRAKGQVKENWGETKRKVSNAVKDIGDKINR